MISEQVAIQLLGGTVGLLTLCLAGLYASSRTVSRESRQRLQEMSHLESDDEASTPGVRVLGALGGFPVPPQLITWAVNRADIRFGQTNTLGSITALQYIRAKVAVALIIWVLLLSGAAFSLIPLAAAFGMGALAASVVWLVPDWYLSERAQARALEINRAVPDLLDLLVVSVEGGLSLEAAMRRIAVRFPGALGQELRRGIRDIEIGVLLADSLRSMAERTHAEELRRFVTPFLQAQLLGVSVAPQLRALADDMRTRRQQTAQEAGRSAATRVLLPMMLCIFPALLIVVVGPAILRFFGSLLAP